MRTGKCQCGEIRFDSEGDPFALYICHCQECQRQSASAFGISLRVPRAGIRVTQGTPKSWSRIAGSGTRIKSFFCPTCGSRLWHEPEAAPEVSTIKGGTLDEPLDVSNAIHIWVKRKLPGIVIPEGAKQFPEGPVS